MTKTITVKVTATSGKGIESLPAIATALIDDANAIVLRLAAVKTLRLRAIAGGDVEIDLFYVQGSTPATEIQFAVATETGDADFTAPALTTPLSGRTVKRSIKFGQIFTHGQILRVAARAVCTGGYSDIVYSNTVAIAAVAPEIVLNYAEVAVYE